jgi:hypothetical protein
MLCAIWFGGTFLYFIKYLRKTTDYEFTTIKLIIYFLGNIKNIYKFYHLFYRTHQKNKYGIKLTYFLLISHIIAPILWWFIVIIGN